MPIEPHTRRAFLRATGLGGAAWLVAETAGFRDALAWAAEQRSLQEPRFQSLAPARAADLEAVMARILPSGDGQPGAREAGAVHFLDRALATFASDLRPVVEEGIADLNRRAAAKWPGTTSFATLAPERQDEVLREIEESDFFGAVHFHTVAGTFGDPAWGGNRDHTGWALIGHDHQPYYQPPFGWYDNDANRRG